MNTLPHSLADEPLAFLRQLVRAARIDPPRAAPAAAPADASAFASTLPVDANDRLGGVRLAGTIGMGGMGTVWQGRHEILDIDVAVKVMKEVADPDRFLKEARLAARVQHQHIVRVLHAGRERGRLFLVMELVDGANLKQVLAQQGPLPWPVAVALISQAARGLGAAHRAGIVHRDIKPSNLMVTVDGLVKVADLGLAREAIGDDDRTETGIIVGTPAYMAPEQARDSSAADARADVYAMGATLFHLLAGEPPFKRSSQTSVLLAHLNEPAPDPRLFVKELPPALVALVGRMLAKDPRTRPVDGDAVAAELERISGDSTAPTARAQLMPRRPRPIALAAALGFSLSAGLALVWHADARPLSHAGIVPAAASITAAAGDAVPAVAPDAWQTPERAAFVIADGLDGEAGAALHAAVAATGLRVVERGEIERIAGEHDLSARGRLDPATAVALGRLIGAQVALIASPAGARLHLRAVPIETGEIAGDRLVAGDPSAAVAELTLAAIALLPAQGTVTRAGDELWLSLGRRHGVAIGTRFALTDLAGQDLGIGTATVIEPSRCRLETAATIADGARARRLDQP